MHEFFELADQCTNYTLNNLKKTNDEACEKLERGGETSLVKIVQMIQLQKIIIAVGMFSIFEANLQDKLKCKNGFTRTKEILSDSGELDLRDSFNIYYLAINVLKHGKGRSYESLIEKANDLPFRIKMPDESFFNEGDVSEVYTLIEVDDEFVQNCAEVITDVSNVLRQSPLDFI